MRSARVLFGLIFLVFVFLFLGTKHASAQTSNYTNSTPASPAGGTNSYAAPKMDPDVPRNQHTYAQAVTIEVLASIMCQLTGIDPINPGSPCLGINPKTRQLGYAPNNPTMNGQNGSDELHVGGMLGVTTDLIASTYRPFVSTGVYTEYLSSNFGIVKKAYAQTSYGFTGLQPVLNLWIAVRNMAYGLLVIAFVFIGVGVMLRIKIDPRTVMTIQNQIPKVIIAIILITFSYAISALLVDLMWVSTYAGVNLIAGQAPSLSVGGDTLAEKSTRQLLELPIVYVNGIFHTDEAGIFHLTDKVSENIGSIIRDVLDNIFNVGTDGKCFSVGITSGVDFSPKTCVANLLSGLASFVVQLVIFVILIVTLFRIWFMLLKAYVYSLLYVVVAPLFIVFGLLPSKPLGFEKWLRAIFVNLAVFPLTAFLIVGARVLMDVFDAGTPGQFIPPLIGHNASGNFGAILAFGALLLAPSLQKILQEKMGVKGVGSPGLIAAGAAAGAAVVGQPVGRAMKHLNRTDSHNQALGGLARFKKQAGQTTLGAVSKSKIPFVSGYAGRAKGRREAVYNKTPHESEAQVREAYNQGLKPSGGALPPRSKRWIRKHDKKAEKTGGETWAAKGAAAGAAEAERAAAASAAAGGHAPTTQKEGSAFTDPGSSDVTITGPVEAIGGVNIPRIIASGGDEASAKSAFIGNRFDEHVNTHGGIETSARKAITDRVEIMLKSKTPDQIGKMKAPDWKSVFEKAHREEKGGSTTT